MLMERIKLLFASLLVLFAVATANAQNIKVSGVVTDEAGFPVPGATVMIPNTTTGTSTNGAGEYTLTVPSNATLLVTCVGYKDVLVSVGGRAKIDITIKEDVSVLEQSIVVGYGSAQKVGNLVGSVKTVSSETIKASATASPLDMLSGQVAGLSVLTTGGVAGDNNVSLTLHGIGSLSSGTTPLFIVDGVPASSSTVMNMNPNDILAMSVLKDASATSIYGSRAANGVVFVTTKTGAYNNSASVTVRSQYGISTLADFTMYKNMMSGDELKDFWINSGIYTYDYVKTVYTDRGYNYNTKWHKYFQQFNNPQSQNDVTIEGGSNVVAYNISASQFHQRGNTIGNYYDRYTLRTNVQAHPKDWLKVGTNINFSVSQKSSNGNWGDSENAGGNNYLVGGLSMMLNPLYPAIDPVTGSRYEYVYPLFASAYNWETFVKYRGNYTNYYGVMGSAFVELEPIKNLKITSRAGVDARFNSFKYRSMAAWAEMFPSYTSGRSRSFTRDYSATVTNTIEYSHVFNDNHRFSVLAGHEGIYNDYDYFWAYSENQIDDRLLLLQNGEQETFDMEESRSQSSFLSFFAHADYSLMDKYIIDVSARTDASSRFGSDNRWARFWAAGVLWKAKKEAFLKDVEWLNELSLKVSYGTQGNAAIGNYSSHATLGSAGNYAGVASLVIASPNNKNLSWEQQALGTVAVSARVFDKVSVEVEVYNRKTTDMLMSRPLPYSTGFTSVTTNVGGLQNRGIDITIGVDILKSKDYALNFNAAFNYNKQKITELFDGRKEWEIVNTGITYVVGQPVSFYYPIYAGVDPADGKQMWYLPGEDINVCTKDPSRTTKVFSEADLRQNTGKERYAPINGGFGISGRYKNLSVKADFNYTLGKYLINNDAFFYNNPNTFAGYNQSKAVTDFWTPRNTDAKYPSWADGTEMQFDTHLLENASFMRLKSLQIGYSLPKTLLNWAGGVLSDVKFTFTGRNLFTITKYMGSDPEADSNITLGLPGNTRQYLGGIEITF